MRKLIKSDVSLFGEICSTFKIDNQDALWAILNKYQIKHLAGFESLDSCVSRFLNAKSCDGISETTKANYTFALKSFQAFIKDNTPPANIETDDIRSYVLFLKNNKHLKETSISQNIAIVKSFFNWLFNEGLILDNPSTTINVKYEFKNIRQPLSNEQLTDIRNACIDKREKAIIEWFINTGCRLGEVANTKIEDINFDTCSAVVTGKGNKSRIVFFNSKTSNIIQNYLKDRAGNSEYLFSTTRGNCDYLTHAGLESIIRKIGKRAGLEDNLFPHLFRHTFATNAVNNGMEMSIVSNILGHSSCNITSEVYAKYKTSTLRNAYNNIFENNKLLLVS